MKKNPEISASGLAGFLDTVRSTYHSIRINDYARWIIRDAGFSSLLNLSSTALFVADFTKARYVFVSENVKAVMGYERSFFLDNEISVFQSLFKPEEVRAMDELTAQQTRILQLLPPDEVKNHKFVSTYHLRQPDGSYRFMMQHYLFIETAPGNIPLVMLGSVTDITHLNIHQTLQFSCFRFVDDKGWQPVAQLMKVVDSTLKDSLNKREHEVLHHIQQGLSTKMIADKLGISFHTVQTHRKNLLKKTGAANAAQLAGFRW